MSATKPEFSDPNELLSFPDGDIVLRSSDKIDFHVDLVLLRRASSFFDDLAKLPHPPTASDATGSEPLEMEEPADVLNIILRHLYPVVPPSITTSAQSEHLLRAVNRLDLSIYSLDRALDAHLASMPPLRAWALAIRYNRTTARRESVARYLIGEDQPLEHFLVELDSVSAKDLAILLSIKKQAVATATKQLQHVRFCCQSHRSIPLRYWQKIEMSPLDSTLLSDDVLGPLVRETGRDCCETYFESPSSLTKRRKAREAIKSILDDAVNSEDPMHIPDSRSDEEAAPPPSSQV